MKRIKSHLVLTAAVVIAAITMSFKMATNSVTYHYTSNSTTEGQFANTSNWATGSGSCGSLGNKPCDIDVPDGSDLATVLSGKTNAQVLAINPSSRRN